MSALDKLLRLEHRRLEVCRDIQGRIMVNYAGAYISDPPMLVGVCGRGATFDAACEDYLRQISGKRLVFGANTDHRTEVIVL